MEIPVTSGKDESLELRNTTGQDYGLNYKWSHVVWIRLSPNIKQASRGYNTSSHKVEVPYNILLAFVIV